MTTITLPESEGSLAPEHLEILASRLAAHREHPERARSAHEVIDRLAKRSRVGQPRDTAVKLS